MLRAALLAVLSVSTVSACKSQSETSAKAQPGVVAGKVLEAKGSVQVKHADATAALAAGATVEGSDTIITGPDGSVVIELAHNSARWELGPNKQQKVSDSIAWNAKKATAEDVEHATAAAGRPAERHAAGTVATADEGAMAEAAPAQAPAAPAAAPEPDLIAKGGDTEERAAPAPVRRPRPAKVAAAPPPPPEPMAESMKEADDEAPRTTRGASRKKEISAPTAPITASAAPSPSPPPPAPTGGTSTSAVATPRDQLATKQPQLKACLKDHGEAVLITVAGTAAKHTVAISSKNEVAAELQACVKKVIATITFNNVVTFNAQLKIFP